MVVKELIDELLKLPGDADARAAVQDILGSLFIAPNISGRVIIESIQTNSFEGEPPLEISGSSGY